MRGDGSDGGDEDVGEHRQMAGKARNEKVGDPVGSQRTEGRGFGHWNVRQSERLTTAANGDWPLWNVSR